MTICDGSWGTSGLPVGTGAGGKKRRKEPIDMTIEEMEAEIEETNEAIRKRRRNNLGLLLKPLWMLTVIACLVGEPVAAFTAYDCSNRSNTVEAWSRTPAPTQAGMERWRLRYTGKLSRSSRTE